MKVMVEFEIEEAEGLLAVCGEVPPINFGPHAAAGRERLQQAVKVERGCGGSAEPTPGQAELEKAA
jgi:hypothetical protein